jgi:hypothetical protein
MEPDRGCECHHIAKIFKTLRSFIVLNSVADSGSGIRSLFDPWIRDTGWVKNQDPDPG